MSPSQDLSIFAAALGIAAPWKLISIEFDEVKGELHLRVDCNAGERFPCPDGSGLVGRYDSRERTWRHLNFWQHKTFISANVPRVRCSDGSVQMIEVPWATKGSGFTLMFEAAALLLMRNMPVAAVADIVDEHDTRLWRLLHRHVEAWKPKIDMSKTTAICVDETAAKRGHTYITLVIDATTKRLLFATEGRDKSTIYRFSEIMSVQGGDPMRVTHAAIDMSNAFKGGVADHFPNATIVYDRFHIAQWMNKAVDQVRRSEVREKTELKGTKFLWLKRHDRLSDDERALLGEFIQSRKKTAKAYQLKVLWDEFYKQKTELEAKGFLKAWVNSAIESNILPMMKIACIINASWQRFTSWISTPISTAINEGTNSIVQAIRARARGYKNPLNFINMCYFLRSGMPELKPT
jgi:transposase